MIRAAASSAVALALLLALTGCAKQKECKETSEAINAAVTRIEGMSFEGEDSEATIKNVDALVKAAEEEGAKIAKVQITTEELTKHVDEYKKMLGDVVAAAKQLLTAAKQSAELEKEADKAQKEVQSALDAIGKECERGASGCLELAQRMSAGPSGEEEDDQLAEAMKKYAKDLSELKLPDPKVAEALGKLVTAVTNQAAVLDKALKAEKDVDGAIEAMDKAVEPEDRIVDTLNRYCGT
jgi:chromosome segregation ATPase